MKWHIWWSECWFGLRPKVLSIHPLGVSVEFYMYKTRKSRKKVVTYLAGPLMNLGLALVCMTLPVNEIVKMKIIYTNLLLAIFNLLPMIPLDGGKILKEILQKSIGNKKATIFMNQLTQAILVMITIFYSIVILQIKNFAIFLLILYLWYLKYLEDRKIKTMMRAYEVIERA